MGLYGDLDLMQSGAVRRLRWSKSELPVENGFHQPYPLPHQCYALLRAVDKNHIPVSYIDKIVVKNEAKKIEIAEIVRNLGLDIPVVVAVEGRLYY